MAYTSNFDYEGLKFTDDKIIGMAHTMYKNKLYLSSFNTIFMFIIYDLSVNPPTRKRLLHTEKAFADKISVDTALRPDSSLYLNYSSTDHTPTIKMRQGTKIKFHFDTTKEMAI